MVLKISAVILLVQFGFNIGLSVVLGFNYKTEGFLNTVEIIWFSTGCLLILSSIIRLAITGEGLAPPSNRQRRSKETDE